MSQLPLTPPFTVISGGQTGADLAGLLAAQDAGIFTTGWAPRGYKTEKGSQPLLGARFNLIEHEDSGYTGRTEANVRDSQFTLIFAPQSESAGTKKTVQACHQYDRGYLLITELTPEVAAHITATLFLMRVQILNIAGNRETVSPGLCKKVRAFLKPILAHHLNQIQHMPRRTPRTAPTAPGAAS